MDDIRSLLLYKFAYLAFNLLDEFDLVLRHWIRDWDGVYSASFLLGRQGSGEGIDPTLVRALFDGIDIPVVELDPNTTATALGEIVYDMTTLSLDVVRQHIEAIRDAEARLCDDIYPQAVDVFQVDTTTPIGTLIRRLGWAA